MADWRDSLKERHAALFDALDWRTHVRGLNDRLGLAGRYRFAESRWPPEFFVGALERFRAREWLAVVSLNPKEGPEADRAWYEAQDWNAADHWAYLIREGLRGYQPADFYYAKWAYPLLLLQSEIAGDESVLTRPEESYFYGVGAFELIPYASHGYAAGTFAAIEDDPGCAFSREIALAVLANCPPAAVVANGLDAVATVSDWLPLDGPLVEHRYESAHRPGRMLRHVQSSISVGEHVVPFAGFPFLRSQAGHNAYAEIRQLGREIRDRR